MEYLRTPNERFENLPDFHYKPHYLQNGDLRMAYIDERSGDGSEVFLCLHGEPTWSFLYRKMIPPLLNYTTDTKRTPSRRVVAPDFYGFGRSDKPSQDSSYNFDLHRDAILSLIEKLNLTNITLVVQDWGGAIGLTLPIADPSRFKRLLVMNTALSTNAEKGQEVHDWIAYTSSQPDLDIVNLMVDVLGHPNLTDDEQRAYRAPFPDASYKAGVRGFPQMIMVREDMPGMAISKESRRFFETADTTFGKDDVLVVCGAQDRILGPPRMRALAGMFKHGCRYAEIADASHFVQEWGEQVARLAVKVFEGQEVGGSVVEKIVPGTVLK